MFGILQARPSWADSLWRTALSLQLVSSSVKTGVTRWKFIISVNPWKKIKLCHINHLIRNIMSIYRSFGMDEVIHQWYNICQMCLYLFKDAGQLYFCLFTWWTDHKTGKWISQTEVLNIQDVNQHKMAHKGLIPWDSNKALIFSVCSIGVKDGSITSPLV